MRDEPRGEPTLITLADARRRVALAKARMAELDAAEDSERLYDAADCLQRWAEDWPLILPRLRSIPARVASRLVADHDDNLVRVDRATLEAIDDVLTEIADSCD